MDAGVVLLSLTQKVLALDATKVVLVSFSGASVASVRLGAPSFVEGVSLGNADAKVSAWQLLTAERRPLDAVGGETQVRIVLAEDDVWRLQRAGFGLGKRARATYLAVDALAARTPAFSVAVASPLSVARRLEDVALSLDPSAFRPDQTAPTLRGFGVDMQAGTLYLNFSEPVRLASLNVSGLRLGAMQFQEGVALEDSAVAEEDAVYAECGNSAGNRSRGCSFAAVRLGARDVDAVKAQRAGDWISADAGVARDLALPGNAMLSLDKALYRALFVKDTWPPNLETWGLDLDRGLVHLNLSEPVDPQSLNASRMLLGNAHGEVRLREAESHQRAGTKELVLVLGRDLLPLKALLAAAPGANSTFLSAAEGFVADMAFPAPANFARGSSILARFVVPDRTGPRLFGFEVDVPNLVVRLYFNEPVLAEINASALVFRNVNSFAATSVRLSDSAGAVGAFGCEVRIDLSNQDASRMTANGIGEKAYLEHDGGVCRDASGNAAVAGAGPGVVDATFEKVGFAAAPAGLAADSALAAGPVVAAFRLDMDSGAMKVTLYHPMRHAVNVTSLSLASTDSGFAYALTANSTATVEVDYGDAGDVVFTVQLSLEDVLGVKLADGGLGAAPLASLASNTFLAVGSAFARSSTSFKTVPRQVDSALGPVATVEFFPDVSAPKLVSVQVDMNTGRVTFLWDEPVRAAEADVGKVWFSGAASAQTAGRTLTDSLSLSRGASLTVQIQLGAADLNEMKRRDGLATGLNDTFYGFNFGTFVDRAAGAGNPADAVVLARAVDGFLPDVTDAIFESYDVDLQACTLTLRFIEPMVVASFNATAVTVQESDFADTGQRYRLGPDSYASATSDSTASQTLVVALSENDCAGINIESRLAKSIDTTRITMEPEAARDVAGNRVTRIYDGAGMAPSAYTPDSTPPQLLRFWIDVDRGTLTFNFTEPVLFGSFVATRFSLQSGSTGSVMQLRTISRAASLEKWLPLYGAEDPAYAADDSFASFYGAGATVTVTLARQDVLLLQSRPLIAADRDSTWLAAVPGGFQDMSGNPLLKTAQRAAFFVPDTTRPALERFDLDMDAGQLVLYFSEAPNLETLDMAKFLVCAGACVRLFAEATSAVSQGLATVDPDVLTFAAGPALHDALRTARIGITTAFIAADEGAVEDAVGLPLVRLLPPNVAAQRDPLRVHSLVCDTTGPALRRATYSGGELRLYFDEPVDADSAQAALVTVGRLGAVFALDATTAVTSPSPRVLAFDLARDCLLFEHEACPASPDTVPASPDAVNQTCRGLCDSARADALLEAGGALFVAAAEGAVEDYGDNPSLRYSAFSSPPSCACADGAYIAVACNAFDDAVCAACSVECRAGFFQTSDCGEFADVGCSRCTPCGFPFFAAGGCTGVLDTECAACTACTEVEYEVSQCAAGADRTCETCQTDQECVEPSAQCEDTAKWWRQENCCLDADGDRISCNARAEAALRIAARNGRRHWVFDQTFPAVEAGFDQGALLP